MKIYSKLGDDGQTDLLKGDRVDKDSLQISCIGTIDELNSLIGIARVKVQTSNVNQALEYVQNALFEIGSIVAGNTDIKVPNVKNLEEVIDEIEKILPPLRKFILPCGHEGAAFLHHARAVCRRVERLTVALNKRVGIAEGVIPFVNRLSDFLFVMARYINHHYMIHETVWNATGEIENEITKNQTTLEEAVEAAEESGSENTAESASVEIELPEVEAVEPKKTKKRTKVKNN